MSQVQSDFQAEQQNSNVATQNQSVASLAPRIERCEFEHLLERAMEILSAGHENRPASHA